ncbi:MAG: hypothetical protein KC485_04555, partial [Gemmatimonadetes bacterium]|nr:hypothetical protein [Gemmatimonadota bacterium]
MQCVGDQLDAAHRDAPGEREVERATGGVPQLGVERARRESDRAARGGVVGVAHVEHQPTGGVAARAQSAAEALGHGAQQPREHAAVVGVGGQHVRHPTLGA